MVRVMVTGGTGFVGSHVVVGLLASGHEVRLLVRRPELVAETFAPHVRSQAIAHGISAGHLDERYRPSRSATMPR